jgi:transposase
LPWGAHPVVIAYTPVRVRCEACDSTAVEMIAWAEPKQRQSRRLQQHIAVQAMSMPTSHVAALNQLDWSTVQRCTDASIDRWNASRHDKPTLTHVGVDEKYLGRRGKRTDKFITIVSDLKTGEPVWIGHGRRAETLTTWLSSLSAEQKSALCVFAMDMHEPFAAAVRADPALSHVTITHDPFHIMKRVGEAVDEVRRAELFRAGPELRAIGRGTRWLFLRGSERLTDEMHDQLADVLKANSKLMLAYTVKEQMRDVLRSTPDDILVNLDALMRRIQRRANVPMRKLYDSIRQHMPAIVAFVQHRPPAGRIEALNNNWETLVRRGRGYRNLGRVLNYLRFMTINPTRRAEGITQLLAQAA